MQLENFLKDTYGLSGRLTRLGGDLDQNYLFEGDFGKSIFKLMHPSFDIGVIEMQVAALKHLENKMLPFETPKVLPSLAGDTLVRYNDQDRQLTGWMITHLGGTLLAKAKPFSPAVTASLGTCLSQLDDALSDFTHPSLKRSFHWDILQAHWLDDKLSLHTDPHQRAIIQDVAADYHRQYPRLKACPRTVTHHDANDMNLFVKDGVCGQEISGVIDFGDLIYSARIGEVAIAAAYTSMDSEPSLENAAALLSSYHKSTPLTDTEIELFFSLMRVRLAVTVTNSAERVLTEPNDPYLKLHSAPAWRLLERFHGIDMTLITGYFRQACGLPASATCDAVREFLSRKNGDFSPIFKGVSLKSAYKLNLSVGAEIPTNGPVKGDSKALASAIAAALEASGHTLAIGGYGEERPIYTGEAFGGASVAQSPPHRTHHLGVDITVPAGTPIFAPLDGVIWAVGDASDQFDYGGFLILEHKPKKGVSFYSLYGHLSPASLVHLHDKSNVSAGYKLGNIGQYSENGGWWPHLHLQILTQEPSLKGTPPGACEKLLFPPAKSLYPNPAPLLNLPDSATN